MSVEELSESALSLVSGLARELRLEQAALSALEEKVKAANERIRTLETVRLPEAMSELELQKLVLADGTTLTVGTEYYAGIKKENGPTAFAWLREHELGDVVKNVVKVEFGRGQDELAAELFRELGEKFDAEFIPVSQDESVHASTLKALAKQQIESGNPLPEDLFGVYTINRAKIKLPK